MTRCAESPDLEWDSLTKDRIVGKVLLFGLHMRSLLIAFLLVFPAAGLGSDPVEELQKKLNSGQAKLEFEGERGYLASLLKNLDVPISSQTLVFSKTSLQSEGISPASPRALYFNDDVYVAWVQGTSLIEIASIDSQRGSLFYFLPQRQNEKPEFERSTGHECSVCHYSREAAPKFVPLLMVSSVIPDKSGKVEGAFPIPTTDQSPLNERWGGWYVTGTHGKQRHLGNLTRQAPASAFGDLSDLDLSKTSNVTDLSNLFNTKPYLSPHSDVVALMVLAHQVEMHNLIAFASGKQDLSAEKTGEPLVKALLFSRAAPFAEPVQGTSSFAADFARRGPRDSQGRSLRDFDLKTRLFRYPLSYLIYSTSFDEMPDDVKTYVFRRLREILTGKDQSPDFAHLSSSDRKAILEILQETKPDFRQ
jgi:hypothetical protein